jgi:murein DD-endopeptidase MepM/ murein hydrolase activator NlpD
MDTVHRLLAKRFIYFLALMLQSHLMKPALKLLKRIRVFNQGFWLAGLACISAIVLGWGPSTAALEPTTQLATGATWQGASFPVENFQGYTSPFGYRQSPDGSYNQEFHRGLDMAAPEGSYVRSWWTGKVVEVTDDSACGTSIVIQSGEWEHIYCHMQGYVEKDGRGRYLSDRAGNLQIWEGQAITAGTRIGRVGMTGRTTGPHLHWGLKYSSNWVDPALVLRAMYAEQSGGQSVSSRPR